MNSPQEIGPTDLTIQSGEIMDKDDNRANDIENYPQLAPSDGEISSATTGSAESRTLEKDFPALAPSKSMDFPDGSFILSKIDNI